MTQDYIEQKTKQIIEECELHIKRINYSANKLNQLMPLDEKAFKSLDEAQMESLDQFLFRFSKL